MTLTNKQIEQANSYKEVGMSLSWISRKLNIPLGKIKYLREIGLLKNSKYRTKKDLFCNYKFFKKIDTEQKAYWLGFIYADGCITDNGHLSILLSRKDHSHLESFKRDIEAEHSVKKGVIKRKENKEMSMRAGQQYTSVINIHSKEMRDDLARVGVSPRKSLALDFPSYDQVPENLIHHFVRGCFDGDGHVCYKKSSGNGDSVAVGFLSSDLFCSKLSYFLHLKLNLNLKSITPHHRTKGISSVVYGGKADFLKIREFLYSDATVFLERKRIKFFSYVGKEFQYDWHKILYKILTLDSVFFGYKWINDVMPNCERNMSGSISKIIKLGIVKQFGWEGRKRKFQRICDKMSHEEAMRLIEKVGNQAVIDSVNKRLKRAPTLELAEKRFDELIETNYFKENDIKNSKIE